MNQSKNTVKDIERVYIFDLLRGIAIVLMVIHHTLFDLYYIFNVSSSLPAYEFTNNIIFIAQWLFVMISGACVVFGHSPEKRGAELFVLGTAITLVTLIFIPSEIIICDVLCLLGFCMMVYSMTKRFVLKIPSVVGFLIFILLFVFTYNISKGFLGFPGIIKIALPASLYQSDALCFFGFISENFYSANYWPVFPTIFLFFASIYIGKWAKAGKFPAISYRSICRPLEFCGRHSLIIYIVHQPIIYGILWVIINLIL